MGQVRFDGPSSGIPFPNRVDYNPAGVTQMRMWRVGKIRDELGSVTYIDYTQPKVCSNPVTSDPQWQGFNSNTWSCFARWWAPPSGAAGSALAQDVVSAVTVRDLTGVNPDMVTTYSYPASKNPGIAGLAYNGSMAWHGDTDRFVPVGRRSWGVPWIRRSGGHRGDSRRAGRDEAPFFVDARRQALPYVVHDDEDGVDVNRAARVDGDSEPTDLDELAGLRLVRQCRTERHTRRFTCGQLGRHDRHLGFDPNVTWVEPFRDYAYANGKNSRTDDAMTPTAARRR